MKYYPNSDWSCFASSLCNFLLESEDEATAKKVWKQYKRHPLVRSDGGMIGQTAPVLISDLTDNKYEGLYRGALPRDFKRWQNTVRTFFSSEPAKADRVLRLYDGIIPPPGVQWVYHGASIEQDPPALISVHYTLSGAGHWIIDMDTYVIDDGKRKNYSLDDFMTQKRAIGVNGILKIQKK